MKTFAKHRFIAAALACAFVGASAGAMAQSADKPEPELHAQHMAQRAESGAGADQRANMQNKRHERMQQRMAKHQAKLKSALALSPEQEPAWNAFVARTEMPPAKPRERGDREAWTKLSTPERLDKMQAMKTERDARMAQRVDAIKSFYAALTPVQQKTFDEQGMRMHRTAMSGKHHKSHQRMGKPGPSGEACGADAPPPQRG